jgi:hypothetical protein
MLAEEVHRGLIGDHQFEKADNLIRAIEQNARQSQIVKLLRRRPTEASSTSEAEREGGWILHLATVGKMLP